LPIKKVQPVLFSKFSFPKFSFPKFSFPKLSILLPEKVRPAGQCVNF